MKKIILVFLMFLGMGLFAQTKDVKSVPYGKGTITIPIYTFRIEPVGIYYSVEMTGTAVKDNCKSGYTGTEVTYRVMAGRYISLISQEDADQKAMQDIEQNKQTYANMYGNCIRVAK